MKTVAELIEYMKIPQECIEDSENRPNIKYLLDLIDRGKVESALKHYEFCQNIKRLFCTRKELINLKTRKNNRRFRKAYGSNWVKRRKILVDLMYEEQNCKCNFCKNIFQKQQLEVDHVVRIADGGSNLRQNMQLLCRNCHDIKDNYPKGTISDGIHDKKIKV